MDSTEKLSQEKFKELMQDIYVKGQESESINTEEILIELTNKLSLILKEHEI